MSFDEFRTGSTEPWTVDILCALVRAQKPYVIVETGTFEGRTTARLVEAMMSYLHEHEARLFTVESDPERVKAAWDRILPPGSVNFTIMQGDAIAFLSQCEPPDFVFLDDDHTEAHVREEIRLVLKILRPGGIVCVHDVIGPFGLGGVVKEYGGVVLDLPRLHAAGGLGIIAK